MLRIVHTGRAYEVLDLLPVNYRLELEKAYREVGDLKYALDKLRNKYARARDCYWRQKTLLEDTEQKLRAAERKLKSCQKSTLDTHDPQDPR